jgi:hypothetical protein
MFIFIKFKLIWSLVAQHCQLYLGETLQTSLTPLGRSIIFLLGDESEQNPRRWAAPYSVQLWGIGGQRVMFKNLQSSSQRQEASKMDEDRSEMWCQADSRNVSGICWSQCWGWRQLDDDREATRVTAHTALVPRLREPWGLQGRKQLDCEVDPSAEGGSRWSQEEETMRLMLWTICPSH